MTTYIYKPISGERCFRAVSLLPGKANEPLQCELLNIDLNDKPPPKFETLSYVWGATDPPCFIECEDSQIQITQNCHDALHALRRRRQKRVIFVDAIGINQTDTAEQSKQIQLMGGIFSRTNVAFAWLGKETPERRSVMKCLAVLTPFWYLRILGHYLSTWSPVPLSNVRVAFQAVGLTPENFVRFVLSKSILPLKGIIHC